METSKNESKAYKLTMNLIKGTKYMYIDLVAGIYSTLMYSYQLEHCNDVVQGMMRAIEEYYWDNIEPEWESMETEKFWNNMNVEYFTKYRAKVYNYKTQKEEDDQKYFHYKWAIEIPKRLLVQQ